MHIRALFLIWVLAGLGLMLAPNTKGADWPQWGGKDSRNMVSTTEKGLPSCFEYGKLDKNRKPIPNNIKWAAKITGKGVGSPVVSNGKLFIGTTCKVDSTVGACILCFDEQTGRELGRFFCRLPPKENGVEHCIENWGVASTPTVIEDCLYVVSPYQEVLCVSLKGWPHPNEARTEEDHVPATSDNTLSDLQAVSEQCVIWRYDLAKELKAVQHHVASCSVLVHGDYVYVCTGNGRWMSSAKPYHPLTPSLIVLNKKTGQLVARDDEQIGERLWRGQYSSPSLGVVGNKEQIYFGAGDGTCYAFEPVAPNTQVTPNRWITTTLRGPIIQFHSVSQSEKKDASPAPVDNSAPSTSTTPCPTTSPSQASPSSRFPVETRLSVGTPAASKLDALPTAQVPDVPILKKIWWFDCIPKEYRENPFYAYDFKSDGKGRPCEIMATPVFYKNRVYIAIGGDPRHGGRDSQGNLVCIDATKTGDITQTGKIWSYDKLNQCAATVAIADGLVYAIDESGVVHCLDADTGKCYWTHSVVKSSSVESVSLSPVVADGKVFIAKNILAAGKVLKPLQTELIPVPLYGTPCVANGVLFMVQADWLYAISDKGENVK